MIQKIKLDFTPSVNLGPIIVDMVLGHFGLGCFGPDILSMDVLATENAEGGRFGHNHKFLGLGCVHE